MEIMQRKNKLGLSRRSSLASKFPYQSVTDSNFVRHFFAVSVFDSLKPSYAYWNLASEQARHHETEFRERYCPSHPR
jgi:hypothetical protein